MRISTLALAAVAAASIYASGAARPASAATATVYAYCTTETRWEGSYCRYQSFEQCVAARDVMNATCTPNPRYAGVQAMPDRH